MCARRLYGKTTVKEDKIGEFRRKVLVGPTTFNINSTEVYTRLMNHARKKL